MKTDEKANVQNRIKILALGGFGAKIINMFDFDNSNAIESLVVDTDIHALENVIESETLSVGLEQSGGLSLNGNVQLSETIIEENESKIKSFVRDADVIIAVVGLGGGFGTGAIQKVAEIISSLNKCTSIIYTLPFSFEGNKKNDVSKSVVQNLKNENINVLVEVDSTYFISHSPDKKDLKQTIKNIDNIVLELIYNICYVFNDNEVDSYDKLSTAFEKFSGIKINIKKNEYTAKHYSNREVNLTPIKNLEDIYDVDYAGIDLENYTTPAVLRYRKYKMIEDAKWTEKK